MKCTALLQGAGLLESVLKWHKCQDNIDNILNLDPEGCFEVSSLASPRPAFLDIVTLDSNYDSDQVTVNLKIESKYICI